MSSILRFTPFFLATATALACGQTLDLSGNGTCTTADCADGATSTNDAATDAPNGGDPDGSGRNDGGDRDGGDGGDGGTPTHTPAACHVQAPVRVGTSQSNANAGDPAVRPMWTGTHHLFALRTSPTNGPSWSVRLVRFDRDGVQTADTDLGFDAIPTAAVFHGTRFGLAYTDVTDPTLSFRLFEANGTAIGAPALVTASTTSRLVDAVWTGNAYGILHGDSAVNAAPRLRLVSSAGVAATTPADFVGAGNLGPQALAWTGTEFGALWTGTSSVAAFSRANSAGAKLVDPVPLPTAVGPNDPNPGPASAVALVWVGTHYVGAYVTEAKELFLVRLTAAGVLAGTPVSVATDGTIARPDTVDLVWNGSDVALAWVSGPVDAPRVKMRRFAPSLVPHAGGVTTLPVPAGATTVPDGVRLSWAEDEFIAAFDTNVGRHFTSVCD